MNNNGCIYMHKNKINGKIYIGQTCQKPEKRWDNGRGYKDCPLFFSAIIKYGWNNFEHIILEENINIQNLNEREKFYIALYKSNKKEYGYNLTAGGPLGRGKAVRCVETGKVYPSIKSANIAFGLVEDSCCILRVCKKQQKTSQGFHFEYVDKENEKEGISLSGKGNSKAVRCKNTGQIFPSATEGAKWAGFFGNATSCVSRACKNPNLSAGKHPKTKEKLYWEYVEE